MNEIETIIEKLRFLIEESDDEHLIWALMSGLKFIGGDHSARALLKLTNEDLKEYIRRVAVSELMGLYDDEKFMPSSDMKLEIQNRLLEILEEDKNEEVREQAAYVLPFIVKDEKTELALLNAIKNDSCINVRLEAALRLGFLIHLNRDLKHKKEDLKVLKSAFSEKKNELLKSEFAVALIQAEGSNSEAFPYILDKLAKKEKIENIWHISSIIREYRIFQKARNVQEKIESTKEAIKSQPVSNERNESLDEMKSLEQTIKELVNSVEDAKTEREALKEEFSGTRKSIEETFRKRDYLEVKGHKESLQTQIDLLRDDLTYVKKRADEKITIKDEFSGAWKTISFIALILGTVGTIVSIVLIILKIITITG